MSEYNSDRKICEQLARCLYSDIRGYIREHQSEFEQWVKEEREEQTMDGRLDAQNARVRVKTYGELFVRIRESTSAIMKARSELC